LIFAIAVPIATTVVHMLRERLEARSGRTPLVTVLTKIENIGMRKVRGRRGG
jgi:hypothetical protein